jgi:hypothetical protein
MGSRSVFGYKKQQGEAEASPEKTWKYTLVHAKD